MGIKLKSYKVVEDYITKEKKWNYTVSDKNSEMPMFSIVLNVSGVNIATEILIEGDRIRIKAVLPVKVNPTFDYLLHQKLVSKNPSKNFGVARYDEKIGSVSYEYSFLILHELHKDELDRYLLSVLGGAVTVYNEISNICIGKLNRTEKIEILRKIKGIADDIKVS